MIQDRPFLGVLLMLGFCTFAPIGDALAKILGQSVSVGQLVAIRFVMQAVIMLPIVYFSGGTIRMSSHVLQLTILRTIFHIAGIGMMFMALKYLPLADAIAIAFVMPFIMLMLGKFVLNELVGPHRIIACVVGFIGTLLVIQPNFAAVGAPALLPLAVAVVFALFMLVTRSVAKQVGAMELQASSGLIASAVLVPLLWLFSDSSMFAWTPITTDWVAPMLGLGLIGTFAHLLMTWSLRYAPSATLAPMQYLEIPIATIVGFAWFGDLPNGLAALGILITVAAGLYIIIREQRLSRQVTPPLAE